MPRCPAKDYADRCQALDLEHKMFTHAAIAQTLQRPERWVRRTLARYDERVGLVSLRDRSSRPHVSPKRTPPDIEQAICQLKQAHPPWGRRQVAKQLRWQWRDDAARQALITTARVRAVLQRHPELTPAPPAERQPPPRQIEYLACNLLWAADAHQTRLADGSTWETLHWLDLHSRYDLGQVTAAHLTEDLVLRSFLAVAGHCGLPQLIKTDRDKLFYEPSSGLPTLFERVMAALAVTHLPEGPHQPWWNGVVERRIQTCQREVQLPPAGDDEGVSQAMEAERLFYDNERCHGRCADQPPATLYTPSQRLVPADFALEQVPLTLQPTVVTRQVQASGRVSLAGHSYHFSQRYAHQPVTITVTGWEATAQAVDGWQRSWDLHPQAQMQPAPPPPAGNSPLLTRKVDGRGNLHLSHRLYYVGIAWATLTLPLEAHGAAWCVTLPDGSTKILPPPQLLPTPRQRSSAPRPKTPPALPTRSPVMQTRHVTKKGQISFHHRLYYVGIARCGQTVNVVPVAEGLAVFTTDNAWITTCPWTAGAKPDEPLCPT
jgi:hypothetical protein